MLNLFNKISTILKKVHPGEIVLTIVVVSLINYLYYPGNPGFFSNSFNPFFIIILFFASFYGKISGIFSLFLSVIGIIIISIILNDPSAPDRFFIDIYYNDDLYSSYLMFFFVSFICVIVFGEIRDSLGTILLQRKNEKEKIINRNYKLQQELQALSLVNEEYQDRILGQQNSLISLYSTMISLNTMDLQGIYPNVLEAVVKFSGAVKCSLWKYNRDEHELDLLSSYGWDESERESKKRISDTDTITGWVARNAQLFTVKMLKKYKNLKELDKKENIITVPVNIENRVWGVINIENMPFIKYNLYSEQLILMISDLSSRVIANAIGYIELTKKGEVDPITGLHSLDEMFIVLREEFKNAIENNLNLSFIIVELSNKDAMIDHYSINDVLGVLKDITEIVFSISKGRAIMFQYKERFQFSVIMNNMDHDGVAMFCLNLMEHHSNNTYSIKGEKVNPEILMGYSSLRRNHKSEEDLLFLAENLLTMQKI